MKRPAVARATAGKVLARGCARQGQSTRRRLSSHPTMWNTSATWLVDRALWQRYSSSCRSWHQPRPSRPDLALSSEIACARRAHGVEGDGAAEACSSAPQAACLTTLVTIRPLLGVSDPWHQISNLGPRKALKFGELQPSVQRGWWQIDAIAGRTVAAAGRPLGLANLGGRGSEPGGRDGVMFIGDPRCPVLRLGPFCEGAPNIIFVKRAVQMCVWNS